MSDENQPPKAPAPMKKTSAVSLKKETVRVTLKPDPAPGGAPTPPPAPSAGAPAPPAPTIPLKTAGAPAAPRISDLRADAFAPIARSSQRFLF